MNLKHTVDLLIYASLALGVLLLPQLYFLVPTWLFFSILAGWAAYVVAALAVATGHKAAYPIAFILALVTLFVSLPQPEHYSFVEAGVSLPSVTFIAGSVIQIALLILIPTYLLESGTTARGLAVLGLLTRPSRGSQALSNSSVSQSLFLLSKKTSQVFGLSI